MRNRDVVRAWREGRTASNHHMKTDGEKLWSYNLVIGYTLRHHTPYSQKVALDYTSERAGHCSAFVSMTTSCHVGLAKRVADKVEEPPVR